MKANVVSGEKPLIPSLDVLTQGVLTSFFEALPTAFYTTDSEGRISGFNSRAQELWGRRPGKDDLWSGAFRLLSPEGETIDRMTGPLARAVRARKSFGPVPLIIERESGERIPVLSHPSPLFDQDGKCVGGVNVLINMAGTFEMEEKAYRLAALVESSDDAIISKSLEGIITSWNRGAERIFGYTASEVVGQPVLKLIPKHLHHEEPKILLKLQRGERIENFETTRCTKDGREIDVSLTISPIRREDGTIIGASKIGRDITERKRAEARLAQQARQLNCLKSLSESLIGDADFSRIVNKVTDAATVATGANFGAFFYNVVKNKEPSYMLFALAGAPREAFEGLGMPRATQVFGPTFRGEGSILSDDILADPRYGKNAPNRGMPKGHLPVRSYLASPVRLPSGEILGGLFFGHEEQGRFDLESVQLVENMAAQAAVALDNARLHESTLHEIQQRKGAEQAQDLLLHELKHRVKNALAMIQSIANQTLKSAPPEEMKSFLQRLRSLARANDLMTSGEWQTVAVEDVFRQALEPFSSPVEARFHLACEEHMVAPSQGLYLSLALHELATNAVKYGALSNAEGRVAVEARPDGNRLVVIWRESDGPVVLPPHRQGFGTRMIDRALAQAGAETAFEFHPEGLICKMVIQRADK